MVTELNSFQRQRKNKIILIIYSDLFFLYKLMAVQKSPRLSDSTCVSAVVDVTHRTMRCGISPAPVRELLIQCC